MKNNLVVRIITYSGADRVSYLLESIKQSCEYYAQNCVYW